MEKIDADKFVKAFKQEWDKRCSDDGDRIKKDYSDNKSWTEFMLGDEGLLERVCKELKLHYRREYYTLDALYVSGKDLLGKGKKLYYPSDLPVLIEHEQGDKIEEEMWKLLFWRSPLKVIIFYDYTEEEKNGKKDRESWAQDKLKKKFLWMLREVEGFFEENSKTEYLFIVGDRENEKSLPRWRCVSVRSGEVIDSTELELESLC